MATTPMIGGPALATTRFEYLVAPLKDAKSLKGKDEEAYVPST